MKSSKNIKVFNDGDGRPHFYKELADKLIGKHVIIGYTYYKTDNTIDHQEQKHGVVILANENEGVCVRLPNSDEVIWLPPDLRSWNPARPPGTYKLRSTGEEITDPDYLSNWIVRVSN